MPFRIREDGATLSRPTAIATIFSATATGNSLAGVSPPGSKPGIYPPLLDHFRNRLTHTIEVAQISRTITCATWIEH
jgi:hypothetical protein